MNKNLYEKKKTKTKSTTLYRTNLRVLKKKLYILNYRKIATILYC